MTILEELNTPHLSLFLTDVLLVNVFTARVLSEINLYKMNSSTTRDLDCFNKDKPLK